jgi:hypothetical protein
MYVDDIFGVTRARDLTYDMSTTSDVCTSLLGSQSVETTKSEFGHRLSVIGYDIDLRLQLVTVSRKNVLKALYGFLCTDVDAPITVKILQRLASWASRYGEICRFMRPFVRALYSAYTGRHAKVAFPIPPAARISILVFRVLLSLSAIYETPFCRSLGSFRDRSPQWIVEFDASLTGIGLLWYHRLTSESPEVLLGGCSLSIEYLGFGADASFQNTAEFIAAALGIRGLGAFAGAGQAIELRGDSITALTWAGKRSVRSTLASNASVFYSLQCLASEIDIARITHLSSQMNWRADMLSRGSSLSELAQLDCSVSLSSLRTVNLKAKEVLALCDPSLDPVSDIEGFTSFWQRVRALVADPACLEPRT